MAGTGIECAAPPQHRRHHWNRPGGQSERAQQQPVLEHHDRVRRQPDAERARHPARLRHEPG
jgi:hypothetical protein